MSQRIPLEIDPEEPRFAARGVPLGIAVALLGKARANAAEQSREHGPTLDYECLLVNSASRRERSRDRYRGRGQRTPTSPRCLRWKTTSLVTGAVSQALSTSSVLELTRAPARVAKQEADFFASDPSPEPGSLSSSKRAGKFHAVGQASSRSRWHFDR